MDLFFIFSFFVTVCSEEKQNVENEEREKRFAMESGSRDQ